MLLEEALILLIDAEPTVPAHFGSPARVFPDKLPSPGELIYPAASYQRISAAPIHGVWQDTDWSTTRVQFDVYAETRMAARLAGAALIRAISRYHGTVVKSISESMRIDDIKLDAERDMFESSPALEGVRRVSLDFLVIYKQE